MPADPRLDELAAALIALIGTVNNPRQDDLLLSEARVAIDRALFPLIVRLSALGPMGVAELADHAGRDYTTISRQLAVLEQQGLIRRRAGARDARVKEALLTAEGSRLARRIAGARRRLLGRLLASWTASERETFVRLASKMADGMIDMREGRAG